MLGAVDERGYFGAPRIGPIHALGVSSSLVLAYLVLKPQDLLDWRYPIDDPQHCQAGALHFYVNLSYRWPAREKTAISCPKSANRSKTLDKPPRGSLPPHRRDGGQAAQEYQAWGAPGQILRNLRAVAVSFSSSRHLRPNREADAAAGHAVGSSCHGVHGTHRPLRSIFLCALQAGAGDVGHTAEVVTLGLPMIDAWGDADEHLARLPNGPRRRRPGAVCAIVGPGRV